ncbi:MAG: hypothetical protein DMG12_21310 [Acidobacteria bacterium]|nr:MAG: hypothetical protein DMG12_21310 [Acidobacteriota bacterium]
MTIVDEPQSFDAPRVERPDSSLLKYYAIIPLHLSRNLIQRWLGLATLSIRLFKDSFLGEPHKAGRTRPTQLQKSLICQCVSRVETVMHSNVVNYLFSMEAS